MNTDVPAPRPLFGIVSILFLVSQLAVPVIGYRWTVSALDNSKDAQGQGLGGLILIIVGLVGVMIVLGLAGFAGAMAGGIALARGESRRWTGWIGLFGGGVTFAIVAGTALYLYVAA